MSVYDEKLRRLQQQAERKRRLEAMLRELRQQREELERKAAQLERIKLDEQADVDRLEGGGLAAMFYSLLGKSEEKLTKERREAAAAAVKYEAAARELASIAEDIDNYESELAGLAGVDAEYEATLEEKRGELRRAGGETARRLLELETEASACEGRRKEILEAIAAGSGALATADEILSELDSAEGWATWDTFGGGLLTDIAKHSHLDDAQMLVERLQAQLGAFRTELADVGGLSLGAQVNIDGFLRFADYFFDGIFVDLAVLDRISDSIDQVQVTRERIGSVLERLNAMLESTVAELGEKRGQIDRLVYEAK